jgi:ketosteroid isomerase-like protein
LTDAMPASDTEIVRELFERFYDSGLGDAMELLAEDFVLSVPPSMSAEPDVYEGHAGARRYFEGFEGMIDELAFEALQIEEQGDLVIAWMRFRGRGASSGIEVEQYAAVIARVEDGKVVRMESHPDLETARTVARKW